MGFWPFEKKTSQPCSYSQPAGFVEVTPKNINYPISEHFSLGDFVSKDQPDVWPKYVIIDLRLVDKLELIFAELNREGYSIRHLAILCGFRSPFCNENFGDPRGRGKLSRHMFGDAMDISVEKNVPRWSAQDGHKDITNAEIVAQAAEKVDLSYKTLVGGLGIYPSTSDHGPFVHIDARGFKARWKG